MESKTAIGYAVYCPDRDTFLGRNGAWYSDVRMATIFANPQPARLAGGRSNISWWHTVVEVRITAIPQSIEAAIAAKPSGPAPTPAAPTVPPTVAQPKLAGAQARKAA